MMDGIALNWYCTRCKWEFSVDLALDCTLALAIAYGISQHQVESLNCRGEVYFNSQFIAVKDRVEEGR